MVQVGAEYAITALFTWLLAQAKNRFATSNNLADPQLAEDTARYWVTIAYDVDGNALRQVGSSTEGDQITIELEASDGTRHHATVDQRYAIPLVTRHGQRRL